MVRQLKTILGVALTITPSTWHIYLASLGGCFLSTMKSGPSQGLFWVRVGNALVVSGHNLRVTFTIPAPDGESQ